MVTGIPAVGQSSCVALFGKQMNGGEVHLRKQPARFSVVAMLQLLSMLLNSGQLGLVPAARGCAVD